jgi:hypothetical protein
VPTVNLASNALEFVDFGAYEFTNFCLVVTSNGPGAVPDGLGSYFKDVAEHNGSTREYTSSNKVYWLAVLGTNWYFLTSSNGGGMAFIGTAPGTLGGGPAGNYRVVGGSEAAAFTVTSNGYSGPATGWRFPDPVARAATTNLAASMSFTNGVLNGTNSAVHSANGTNWHILFY